MDSIAFGLMAFGLVLLVVGLARMIAPSFDEFFALVSRDVTSNVGSEGCDE